MNIKYLYCASDKLNGFINSGGPLRFTDINYYKKLENNIIRDDESVKKFHFASKDIESFEWAGIDFTSKMQGDFILGMPTRRCHVLCLSKAKEDENLYIRFQADTCIEINVEILIKEVELQFEYLNISAKVVGKDIEYVKKYDGNYSLDNEANVFIKDHKNFHPEKEYRIAIFYPNDENQQINLEGKRLEKLFGREDFIELFIHDISQLKKIIKRVYKK